MIEEFWKNRRVFLTGHTGFKGSWLAVWLQRLGASVTGYALDPPSTPSLFELAHVADGLQDVRGDIRDLSALTAAVDAARPEIILHLAAQPLVRYSYEHPVETYETNVMGTVHVLEAARASASVKAVLVVTSDKCYDNRGWVWGYRETEPMGGADPYSSSKGCAELVTAAYRHLSSHAGRDSDLAVGSARAGNVIGGGDWAEDRLIPDIMRAFLDQTPVRIRCPDAVRPWQHVLEPLHGYLMLAEKMLNHDPQFADAWNFGPDTDSARPVAEIVTMLAEAWPDEVTWHIDDDPHPPEAHVLRLDSTKARVVLGWRPLINLRETLEWVATWYRAYGDQKDLRQLTEMQLDDYQKRIRYDAIA